MVVTEKCIDARRFESYKLIGNSRPLSEISWSTSDLRQWLNEYFYNTTFSDKEKERIGSIEVPSDDDGKVVSKDFIFILNGDGWNKHPYFDSNRIAYPTDYAASQGISRGEGGECAYWVRGQHNAFLYVMNDFMTPEGKIENSGDMNDETIGVRPAMCIHK